MGATLQETFGKPRVSSRPATPGTFVRIGAQVAAAAAVLAGKAMIALGLRRLPEGWRRTVGVLLRSESTRFALSAFGLQIPAVSVATADADPLQERTAQALRSFLASEPDAHFALEWLEPVTIRRRIEFVDLVVLRFGEDGRLDAITPYLAAEGTSLPPPDARARVHRAVVEAYNRTVLLPEVDRPRQLLKDVQTAVETDATGARAQAMKAYGRRLLSACCLSFESRDLVDPAQRFAPPSFAERRTLGFGYLLCVGRIDRDRESLDLWVSAHHVGLDGVPLQDLLDRLELAWGTVATVLFPPPDPGRAFAGPHPCHVRGERPVDQVVTFVDLSPLLSLRRQLNARHSAAIGGEVTVGTLVAWLLSREPEFAGVRIASTVDVAASGGYERDVDVVSLRPADYAIGRGPWDGFIEFAREFNRRVAAARTRTSPVRVGMQTAGLIPAWAHAILVRANPAALDDTFGTLCVTIVRDARVFIAPMTDLGLWQGFLAIGSAKLPSATGSPVTAISIKGDAGTIAHYPAILQRMIDRCAALLPEFAER